jgi:hypothetical protein
MRRYRLRAAGVVVLAVVVVAALPAAAAPTKWTLVPSPNRGTGDNVLNSVSCPTRRSCVAVGEVVDPANGNGQTLAEVWDGTTWKIVRTPSPGASFEGLAGVSCLTPRSCTAVGGYAEASSGIERTLVEQWDGNAWTVVPSPNPPTVPPNFGGGGSSLQAVSCTTARSCWAVGGSTSYPHTPNDCRTYGIERPLAERWNGKSWTIVAAADTKASACIAYSGFDGISCPTLTFCSAVGVVKDRLAGVSRTLAEVWDGRTWTLLPHLVATGDWYDDPLLSAVSCTSPRSCVAVGYLRINAPFGHATTLAETWNGHAWALDPSPNPSTYKHPASELSGVSCTTRTSCVAVGGYESETAKGRTLVTNWDGHSWTLVSSPSLGFNASPRSVSCATHESCMAVGEYFPDTVNPIARTLVLSGRTTR